MTSGQVPLWVTVALGVLALFGPLGGAWIGGRVTAKRDDQRWEREHQREKEKALRESERERLRLEHEMRTHWSDRRLDAYAAILDVAQDIGFQAGRFMALAEPDDVLPRMSPADWIAANVRLREVMARIRIVGSATVVRKAEAMIGIATRLWADYASLRSDRFDQTLGGELHKVTNELRDACRDDLGVTSPPSDQIS